MLNKRETFVPNGHVSEASPEVAPCSTCGEPLDFSTNGYGKLVEQCPVCDWGWRPRRDYPVFAQRKAAIERLRQAAEDVRPAKGQTYNVDGAIKRRCPCGVVFSPNAYAHRLCSNACKEAHKKAAMQRMKAKWRARGMCSQCGRYPSALGVEICDPCRDRKKQRRGGWTGEALRRYWQKKGAA